MVLVAWLGYQYYVSEAHMCERMDIRSPSPGKRKINLQKIHMACSFGEKNLCVCVTKRVIFLVSRKHHRHIETSHSREEKGSLFTQSYVYVVLSDLDTKKIFHLITCIIWTSVQSHLWVSVQWASSHRPPMFLPCTQISLGARWGVLSTSDSTSAWVSLQILCIQWMMVIIVKDLGYYLFLTSRQHLTVFVYQVAIKILCLDVKLTYFTTNLLLQLIMYYV